MYAAVTAIVKVLKKIIPDPIVEVFRTPYHFALSFIMALSYGLPARGMVVIGVTGTKGKSSVAEMLFTLLRTAGHKTALVSTIRFAIDDTSEPNLFKMTLPGRGFVQQFLAKARKAGVTHVVIEVTSESVRQYRHLFLNLNALIFTNLHKEHIESHGSFEKYAEAKLAIGATLERSSKRPRAIIANADDFYGKKFLQLSVETTLPFSFADASDVTLKEDGVSFTYDGEKFTLSQPGKFSVMNALAVIKTARWLGVSTPRIQEGFTKIDRIAGRAERIETSEKFIVVVDYAHTPDSLKALFEAYPDRKKICIIGSTGGGRDHWKRPEMGKIAEEYCEHVILTNEDPYDEDPVKIMAQIASGMQKSPLMILDRREAIHAALTQAKNGLGDAVLVTGKGTDPYLMGPKGSRTPWNDANVVREELAKLS